MDICEILKTTFSNDPLYPEFYARIQEGKLTREENSHSHFCVYTAIFDPKTKRVLLGHHKKAGRWICNGGHIDKDELPLQAAIRETREEVNVVVDKKNIIGPSVINYIEINPPSPCRVHWHLWYFVPVDELSIDLSFPELKREFYENAWFTYSDAIAKINDSANKQALKWLEKNS